MEKKQLINRLLTTVNKKKQIYQKKMVKFKKIDDILETIIIASGWVSISSIITTLSATDKTFLLIGTVFTSFSTILSAMKRVLNVTGKYESYKTSFTQLSDLERETRIVLVKNHLSGDDIVNLLSDMSNRLSLIEDSALPIKYQEEEEQEVMLEV